MSHISNRPKVARFVMVALVLLMAFAPMASAQGIVQPEGPVAASAGRAESAVAIAAPEGLGGAGSGIVAAGNWLKGQQDTAGWFPWTPGTGTTYNTQGTTARGLLKAYQHSGVAAFKSGAIANGSYILTPPYPARFGDGDPRPSTHDPLFLEELSAVTGDTQYAVFLQTNFWDKLSEGTYGEGDDLTAAEWAALVTTNRTSQSLLDLVPWDLGATAVAAHIAGETATRDAIMAEILTVLNTSVTPDNNDIIGLAGAVWAAGVTGTNLDPTSGPHMIANSTADLAAKLASYQYTSGSWASGTTEPAPGDWQEAQTTAFAILGLKAVDPVAYKVNIARGAAFLRSLQQTDGEILSYVGAAWNVNGSNEVHAEALTALSTVAASTVYVNAAWNGTTAGADPDGAGPATAYGWDAFSKVAEGVDAVAPAGTVNVAAGSYSEALTIGKPVSLVGAGSATTVIGPQVTITGGASGVSGAPTLIKGVNISGGGNDVVLKDGLQYIRFEAMKVGNSGTTGGQGIWAEKDADVAHLQFVNVEFYGNTIDLVFENTDLATASTADDVLVDGCAFSGTGKGIYAEKLSNAVIKNSTFTDVANQTPGPQTPYYGQAVDINLKWGDYSNITIQDCAFTNSGNGPGAAGLGGSAIGIKARGTGTDSNYATRPATLTNVTITGNTITGGQRGVRLGEVGKSNTGPTNVHINNNKFLGIPKLPTGTDAAGAVVNTTTALTDAENNWWGSACGPLAHDASPVSANVDYSPWWLTPTGAAVTPAPITPGMSAADQCAQISLAGPGATINYAVGDYPGGVTVTMDGVKINLNGATVGAGSPAFTITADDVEINGPGMLDGAGSTSPAILVNAGADNFTLQKGIEITGWADGVQVAGAVTSLKIVNNFIHNNTDAGLQVDVAPTTGSVVTIEGNLFKANGGNGIESAVALEAEYNSFGHKDGPASGDGVSSFVDADPWTFAETFIDVDRNTTGEQTVINVDETRTFDMSVLVDAKNLYGFAFKFSYDTSKLQKNSAQAVVPPGYACLVLPGLAANEIGYQCAPSTSGPVVTGLVEIGVANFTATGTALTGNGPWETYFNVDPVASTAGTANGALVYLNNVKLAGVANTRDITDLAGDDGKVVIRGIANFTGFIDVQGRADDSGALLEVFAADTLAIPVLANATSAKGGAYTTAHVGSNLLTIGTPYYFKVDKALYVKTAVAAPGKVLSTRAYTTLAQLVLKGGDADNDEAVDIDDATCIGGAYGAAGPSWLCGANSGSSDVNGDGKVDILDLTLMGGNYGIAASTWAP